MSSMHIRPETPADVADITALIDTAFSGVPYAEGDEAELVVKLRQLGDLAVSLVAEVDSRLVGHVAFSPARSTDGSEGWFALGPIAVAPQRQGEGIGTALVMAGLEAISALGARGCILVGHPGLYRRCGFSNAPDNAPPDQSAEYFMCKVLSGELARGPIYFHDVFSSVA